MSQEDLDKIFTLYDRFQIDIKKRLYQFSSVPKDEYFWELCYCLLTPATRAENANKVVSLLKENNFFMNRFDPTPILKNPKHYIRFHNVKARRLVNLIRYWNSVSEIFNHARIISDEIRINLVKTVDGLGMKEASHFLRNIGYFGFAVLDRHILKNLKNFKVIPNEKVNIGSHRKYLEIEGLFKEFASKIGLSIEELDLLFWAKETGYVLK